MSVVPTFEVQKALVAALNSDTALSALLAAPVRDRRDQNTPFPHMTIGPATVVDDRTTDSDGQEITMTLDTWSRYPGFQQVADIRDAARNAIDRQFITVPGLSSCIAFDDGGNNILDVDGVTRRGVQRIRLMCRI